MAKLVSILRRHAALAFLAVLFSLTASSPASAQNTAPDRAMWVWSTSGILTSHTQLTQFLQFAEAPHGAPSKCVDTVFFAGGLVSQFSDPTFVTKLRNFLYASHDIGLRVDFLCGDPSWATSSGESTGLSYLNAVLGFNASAPDSDAAFDGFQYDVEPYLLSGWPTTAQINGMIDLLNQADTAINAAGHNIIFSATMPRWYDQAVFSYLDRSIIDRVDEIAIMDFVNNSSSLYNDPSGELAYASQQGKAAWIGIETNDQPGASQTTFYGLSNAAMESVFATDLPLFENYDAFTGYAIEDYQGYAALTP